MNKNTTILLGAIALLAIGAGAYYIMSIPSDKKFSTQSFNSYKRQSRQTIPYQNSVEDNYENNNEGNDDVQGKIVKYNSDNTCRVTFDDGITKKGVTQGIGLFGDSGVCCYIQDTSKRTSINDRCYTKGVTIEGGAVQSKGEMTKNITNNTIK